MTMHALRAFAIVETHATRECEVNLTTCRPGEHGFKSPMTYGKSKRIVLTGGGSSGHVVPSLPVGDALAAEGYEIHYIGSATGPEKDIVASRPWPFHAIASDKLRRYLSAQNLAIPFNVAKGFVGAYRTLARLSPAAVFSKGGYVAVPVVLAAWLLRIPIVAHESDLSPGLANRLSLPFCRKLCTTFPARYLKRPNSRKTVFTGLPLRPEFFDASALRADAAFNLDPVRPLLVIFGGSSGSVAINAAVREALPQLLEHYQIVNLVGRGNIDESLTGRVGYQQFEYIHEGMADLLARADLVVSRSGMTTVVELIASRKTAVLIPLPLGASRGDQIENAELVEQLGLFQVLDQAQLTPAALLARIEAAAASANHPARLAAFDSLAIPVTADPIVDVIRSEIQS